MSDDPDSSVGRGLTGNRPPAFAAAAAMLLAVVWFWPTLHHGLRSDDYLLTYYTERITGAVQWDRVFGEFTHGWFGVPFLYRPLVSLSYGIDKALTAAPGWGHFVNVMLLGVTAAATAAVTARLASSRQLLAGLLAGAVVVLHPAAIESTEWIAGRTTALQTACVALACLLFVQHLQGRGPRWPCVLATALALLSKEGAVMLPVSLLALDVLQRPRRPLAQRWAAHWPVLATLLAYFALRWLVLGGLGAAPDEPVTYSSRLANSAVRAWQLLAPVDADVVQHWWPAAMLLLAMPALWRTLGPRALVLPVAVALLLLPTSHMTAANDSFYGRLMFDALPMLALAAGLATAATNSLAAKLGCLGAIGWIVMLPGPGRSWLARLDHEDRDARSVESALATAAATATPAQPFACAALPMLPLFHARLWGVLGMRPVQTNDLAVIGLPDLLFRDADGPSCFGDAAPVHAIFASGGTFATWRSTATFEALPPPAARTDLVSTAGAPREFVPAATWTGCGIAAVHVHLPAAAKTVRLRLLDDFPDARNFGTQEALATSDVWFDVTHAVAPVLLANLGVPLRGFHVEVDGGPPPAGSQLELFGRLPQRALPNPLAGRELALDQLAAALQPPPHDGALQLYLMLPTGSRCAPAVAAGEPLPSELAAHVRYAVTTFAPVTVHWFWQTAPDWHGEPWRSALDWAIVR